MRRMLCAAVAAFALLLPAASAEARVHVFARTKCVGLYCRIVTEPDPRPEPLPATWRKGGAPRRGPKRGGRRRRSPDLMRRAAATARKQPWCDPKRVAECYGCGCINDARRELKRVGR